MDTPTHVTCLNRAMVTFRLADVVPSILRAKARSLPRNSVNMWEEVPGVRRSGGCVNMTQYARPESIVETQWMEEHLNDDGIRIVEADVDIGAYVGGHVPGAVQRDRMSHLNPTIQRDILDIEQMQRLVGESGIGPDTRMILYGDFTNRFTSYAFWQMKIYGHEHVSVLNGGREK